MKFVKLLLLLLISVTMVASAAASTADQARTLAERAIAHIRAIGPDRAYHDFDAPGTRFFDGEIRIFVLDFDGNVLAGGDRRMGGKTLLATRSADNKFFVRDFIDIARQRGEGWYEYKWLDPGTRMVQEKQSFIKRVPGTNNLLACSFSK